MKSAALRLRLPGAKRRQRRNKARRGEPRPARYRLRLTVVGLVVTSFFGALMVRLYYLQVLQPSAAQPLSRALPIRTVYDPAPRGLILSRGGAVLADNRTVFEVTLDRQVGATNKAVVARIAKLLSQTVGQVHQELGNEQISPYQPVPLATGVSIATVIKVREDQDRSLLPGVGVQLAPERNYPLKDTASQLLGYLNRISAQQLAEKQNKGYQADSYIGDSGVEESYDSWLRGIEGTTSYYVDAQGEVEGTAGGTPPTPGDSVVLNLDLGLQKATEKALGNDISSLEGTYDPTDHAYIPSKLSGAAVVLDPDSGAVLAMASLPTYNPNLWVGGISDQAYARLTNPANQEPLLNRAIEGLYPPGSTFKLATASAALADGLLSPTSTIDDSTGTYTIPNCARGPCTFDNDTLSLHPGYIDLPYAIAVSDDVFFYTLGVRFYEDDFATGKPHATPIQDVANDYGLGVTTGIDLPGEFSGAVDSYAVRVYNHTHYPQAFPYPPSWYAGDNLELAFGQGETEITPLQLATAYSTFANGGTRYQPQVAAAVVSPGGKLVKRFSPRAVGSMDLTSDEHAAILEGLEGAVGESYGTAYNTFLSFPLSKLEVAGKTGTASVNGPKGNPEEPDSWFVGFAPANHPRYVVAVVIQNGGYGAAASAVVARDIFSYLLAHPVKPLVLPDSAG